MTRGTAPERGWLGGLLTLVALPSLLACAQIAGTDDYRLGATPTTEAAKPFLTGPGCEECAAEYCGEQVAACEADGLCAKLLFLIRQRPGPLSAYQLEKYETDQIWESQHDGKPLNSPLTNLKNCAWQCEDACGIGRDFSCVGKFEWDLSSPKILTTRATLNGAPVPTRVCACLNADQCDVPLFSQETNEAGFAALTFGSNTGTPGPVGYLRFLRPDALTWQYIQTRPLANNDYVPLDFIDDMSVHEWHLTFSERFAADQGVLIVTPVDCSGFAAKQVTLEAWYYAENQLTLCTDCFEADGGGLTEAPNARLTDFLTTGRGGYLGHVNPGLVYVVLRRVGELRDIISVARLIVRAGEVAVVRAYPSSKRDLDSFPDPKQ